MRRSASASRRRVRWASLAVSAAFLCLLAPSLALAQDADELRRQAERALGRDLSDEDILRFLRQSGLTPAEVRDRLEARGFERTAADPWLRVLEGRADRVPEGTDAAPLVEALGGEPGVRRRPGPLPAPARGDTLEREPEAAIPVGAGAPREPGTLPIFGREVFRRASSEFEPLTAGPVPPDYRLGPGDELVLVLTGGVEQAYELTVSREGWVVIPDVGRVLVNGLTLERLEAVLFDRLSEVYSGIRRGPDATTFFDVSVGALRTNQVYVVGEVERPSAYEVSSLATALGALYRAGGPAESGSLREVHVNRGGETVRRIDLYGYLLRGRADEDVRLRQGDVLFVPPAERRVSMDGAVVRPAVYELRDGEHLGDLIRFAGGLLPEADIRRVQIRRILPPEERAPGADRAYLDVPLSSLDAAEEVPLREGDAVTVFAVLEETRNLVTVSGGVWRPGTYAAGPDTRLWDVIEQAGGLLPDAYEGRAQIQRLREEDYSRRLIPVSLERGPEGEALENPGLRGLDQVYIYPKRRLREERVVSIGGWVRQPGVFPFAEGMTVRDLILKAGGVRTGAYLRQAEVSRVLISQSHTDTLTRRFLVPLDSSYAMGTTSSPGALAGPAEAAPPGAAGGGDAGDREFALRNLDAVYVRRAPGFEPQQNVIVGGQVLLPGPYSLQTRGERLTDLVERAGGLTPEAYPEALQLWRAEPTSESDTLTAAEIAGRTFGGVEGDEEGHEEVGALEERVRMGAVPVRRTRVGVDFVQAMRRPGGPHNVLVEPNDSIFVPRYIPTVEVRGAVGVETRVLYRRGAGLGYYIDQAGGYTEAAEEGRTRVRYANGEVRTRGKGFLFFGGGVPDPDPGSVITVPERPAREEGGIRMRELVGILTSVMTATATVIIATQ